MHGEALGGKRDPSLSVAPLELEDLRARPLVIPSLRLLIFQVGMIILFLLTKQIILLVICRLCNRTCLCKGPLGHWYVINESALPSLRMDLLF